MATTWTTILLLGSVTLGERGRLLWVLPALGILVLPRGARRVIATFRDSLSALRSHPLLVLLGLAALSLAFVAARAPVVFYDAQLYQLGMPVQYLLEGVIRFDPRVVYSGMPMPRIHWSKNQDMSPPKASSATLSMSRATISRLANSCINRCRNS